MIKKLLLICFAIQFMASSAQSDITSSVYQFGKLARVKYMLCIDIVDPNPVAPGANVTWDFTSLKPFDAEDSIIYEYLGTSSPYSSNFSGSNEVIKRSYPAIDLMTHEFFINNSGEYSYLGFANPGGNFLKQYEVKLQKMKFPLSFNDSFELHYTDTVKSTFHSVKYDGYGTLKLPCGTFTNVYRTHTIDSSWNSLYAAHTYEWFDGTRKLMVHFTSGAYGDIEYYESRFPKNTNLETSHASVNLEIYPNPSKGVFTIELPNTSEDVKYVLTHINGQTIQTDVLNANNNNIEIETAGIYFLQLHIGNTIVTKKLVVQ
jgi:hypothetical protein